MERIASEGMWLRLGNTFTKKISGFGDLSSWVEVTDEEKQAYEETKIDVDEINRQIDEIKAELATYDYIGVKIAMGVATVDEYAEQIAYTETLRLKINELQQSL